MIMFTSSRNLRGVSVKKAIRESFFQFKPLDETITCMEKGSPRRIGFS